MNNYQMKKNILRLVLIASFASIIISCQKNDETSPSGGGSGSGLDRDKFLGTWHVTSHHRPSNQTLYWDMTILASTDTSNHAEIFLDNFDQMGSTNFVRASVSGYNFTVPSQTFSGTMYAGSGSYSSSNLSFNYIADDGVQPDTVTATANR